jgi:hypothetical protein
MITLAVDGRKERGVGDAQNHSEYFNHGRGIRLHSSIIKSVNMNRIAIGKAIREPTICDSNRSVLPNSRGRAAITIVSVVGFRFWILAEQSCWRSARLPHCRDELRHAACSRAEASTV